MTRRCARCGDELPEHHTGVLCPFFCIRKVIDQPKVDLNPAWKQKLDAAPLAPNLRALLSYGCFFLEQVFERCDKRESEESIDQYVDAVLAELQRGGYVDPFFESGGRMG